MVCERFEGDDYLLCCAADAANYLPADVFGRTESLITERGMQNLGAFMDLMELAMGSLPSFS